MDDNTLIKGDSKLGSNGKIMTTTNSTPNLILVSTPIGNMGDISLRAIEACRDADRILCEDTRVSRKLLKKYNIETKLSSYHEHNAQKIRPKIIRDLETGAQIVLISDAGTPLISDPGYQLVRACIDNEIQVSSVPGPTALITALAVSGLPPDTFYFGGFLPSKKATRQKVFSEKVDLKTTLIFYESPNRLIGCLEDALFCLGNRDAAVARELTKLHEDIRRGALTDLLEFYKKSGRPKGELVLMIGPPSRKVNTDMEALEALLRKLLKNNSLRDTVKIATDSLGIPRSTVYAHALIVRDAT